MACSDNRHPLKRGGTSQQQRLLDGMKPGYAAIDERDEADWMVFASEFSAYLSYYNADDVAQGNWKPFFENDLSAVLASIAVQNIEGYRLEIKKQFDILKEPGNELAIQKEALGALFAGQFTFIKSLDNYLQKFGDSNPVKAPVQNLIANQLQVVFKKLLIYYKTAKNFGLVKEKAYPEWRILNLPVAAAQEILSEGFSRIWIKGATNWNDFYAALPEDKSIFGLDTWDASRRISHAANHNLFAGLAAQNLQAYSKIIHDAEISLFQTLDQDNSHLPHYALFLSFLKLYRFAKENANGLTQRHLDFYYKEVLRLEPKKAVGNKAHVAIELAKHVEDYLLSAGTLFKAGKDSAGKEVFYQLKKDTLFNKARIARLHTVYKGISADNYGSVDNQGRLFASPVSNSSDGLGAEIKTKYKEWHPFVNKVFTDGVLTDIAMPEAKIGFAIGSANLFMAEGQRLIYLKFVPQLSDAQKTALNGIECLASTAKGWYRIETLAWLSGTTESGTSATLLSLSIPGDAPAIVNYNSKVHGGSFRVDVPLLKVYLSNQADKVYSYGLLKSISIDKIELEVRVGMDGGDVLNGGGLKNLQLSNDTGVLDPSKPFQPFGFAPKKGASFIVGNEELFKKKNAKAYFKVEWKDLPFYNLDIDFSQYSSTSEGFFDPNPKVNAYTLEKGEWKALGSSEISIFNDFIWTSTELDYISKTEIVFPDAILALPSGTIQNYHDTYLPFSINSVSGFLRFSLTDTFGHEDYQKQLTLYLIDKAKPTPSGSPSEPVMPYTPTVQRITIHYKANVSSVLNTAATFENRDIHFFHLHPFGETEQHAHLNGTAPITLLPQFKNATGEKENIAEFYVGLENLEGGQSVNLLFQVLDGSSNPKLSKPEKHVNWSYLSSNLWKPFPDVAVADNTRQLIQPGIISFAIPSDATTENTVLPVGLIWLRASVTENAEAVCKLLSVQAQGALVEFLPNGNANDFLDNSLPAGTISKLKESLAAIKKIEQPYPSFGGRQNESSQQYYVRVSERLRHKSRAITIWDYEHLILEEFPSIYRVKCLNHTRFEEEEYNEVAPGHVTIITIPNLTGRNDADPLRPYTNQNVLDEVKDFMRRKISGHVKLHIRHPQFEEVRLELKVKLVNGLEFNFHHDLLQKSITSYLTPWAYGQPDTIDFGGKVHKSVLINYIEELPFVDYITDVKMYHRRDEMLAESADADLIEASTAKSILVSAPATKHKIVELTELAEATKKEACIDEYNALKD